MGINKKDILILTLPMIGMALLKPVLPEKIAMQWGLDGKVNWYMDRKYSFLIGIVPFIIYKSAKCSKGKVL